MKQIYYEGLYGRLIPVEHLHHTDQPTVLEARVKATLLGYTRGEIIHAHRRHFVTKAGFRNNFQWVKEISNEQVQD